MERIICHWTAGTNKPNAVDRKHYHFLIDGDGKVHNGDFKPEDNIKCRTGKYAAHTLNCNTGSIGIALCGMAGAVESPFQAGKYALNAKQWDAMVNLIVTLSRKYKIGITERTVLTHAEVQGTLGITQRSKWDISRLPWDSSVVGPRAVGNKLRRDVMAAMAPAPQKLATPKPQNAAFTGALPMNKDMILGLVRHALTFGGGFVAAKGWLDQAMVGELIGATMTIIGVVWSAADKKTRV